MRRREYDALALELEEGEKVHVQGRAELFERKGELAFRATAIERFGLGEHLAALERLKRALAAEGLFAAERKRPLPRFPRAVGVLTGADAAARGDIVTAIGTRFPPARIVVAETRVQGTRRASGDRLLARGARSAPAVDVVVVTRGGGSFEDLLPFSDERVVRAFAACPVPIVSAVGHEQDTPLCDLAADVRASTPTAAARLVVPDLDELLTGLARSAGAAEERRADGSSSATARGSRGRRRELASRAAPTARAPARGPRRSRRTPAGALAPRDPRARLRDRACRRLGAPRQLGGGDRRRNRRAARAGRARRNRDGGERAVTGQRRARRSSRPSGSSGRSSHGWSAATSALDEAIELWQRGEALHRRCVALLDAAEGRIEELTREDDRT